MPALTNMIMLDKAKAILKEVEGVVSQSNISQRELEFLRGIVRDDIGFGSPKQNKWVNEIWERVFDNADQD